MHFGSVTLYFQEHSCFHTPGKVLSVLSYTCGNMLLNLRCKRQAEMCLASCSVYIKSHWSLV